MILRSNLAIKFAASALADVEGVFGGFLLFLSRLDFDGIGFALPLAIVVGELELSPRNRLAHALQIASTRVPRLWTSLWRKFPCKPSPLEESMCR